MILKKAKVEVLDKKTRFVLKRISGSDWDCLNRKMAVTNQINSYERQREKWDKSLFASQFQTYHLRWDRAGYWDFSDMDVAKTEAQKKDRLFVVQRQMNAKHWKALNKAQAFNLFEELANKSLSVVTMNIPPTMKNDDWEQLKKDAQSILSGNQKLMPIFSSRHDFASFPEIIQDAVDDLELIGMHDYGLAQPQEFLNLSALRKANLSKEQGQDCPIIFGFNHSRHLFKYSFMPSSFAFSCFGIDVFSERQYFLENMKPEAIEEMMKRKPDQFMFYDTRQGNFNKGEDQRLWYDFSLTREAMRNISVDEGLNGYQVLVWKNTHKQQEDLSILNGKLLEGSDIEKHIQEDKPQWAAFYEKQVKPRI